MREASRGEEKIERERHIASSRQKGSATARWTESKGEKARRIASNEELKTDLEIKVNEQGPRERT